VSLVQSVADRFAAVDPRLVAFGLALQLASFCLRSVAWRNILAAAYPGRVRTIDVAAAYGTGIALNAVVPARGGDAAKIALLRARIHDSSVPTIMATMGVLSVFDSVLGLSLLGLALSLGLLPALPAVPGLPGVGVVTAHPDLLVIGLVSVVGAAVVLLHRLTPRLRGLGARFVQGFAVVRSPRRYGLEVAPLQAAAWLCRLGAAYFLLAAFGLHATVAAALIVIVVGGMANATPVPGGMGTQQLALAYALHATASTTSIVAFSIGMQVSITTLNVVAAATALMLAVRTLRPGAALDAVRSARR
jgi:glycosyltransferase 2 family protein